MKPNVMLAVLAVVVLAIGGFFVLGSSDDETNESSSNETTTAQTEAQNENSNNEVAADAAPLETISAEMVAMHATEDDCWTIVDGSVFDITEYIPRHPGGDEILLACGRDGTTLFTERQTDNGEAVGSGTPHSSNATTALQSFIVGTLEQ